MKCAFCKTKIAVFDVLAQSQGSLCWPCIKDVVRFYQRFVALEEPTKAATT